MKQILLMIVMVALVGGCGKKEPVQPTMPNPEATQPTASNTDATKPEPAKAMPEPTKPKATAGSKPWESPIGLYWFTVHDSISDGTSPTKTTQQIESLVEGLITAEQLKRTNEVMITSEQLAQSSKIVGNFKEGGSYLKAAILKDIASAQMRVGSEKQVLATLNLAALSAQAIEDSDHIEDSASDDQYFGALDKRDELISWIAEATVRAGDLQQAIALTEKIEDSDKRNEYLGSVFNALAQLADRSQAIKMAEKIEDTDLKEEFLSALKQPPIIKPSVVPKQQTIEEKVIAIRDRAERSGGEYLATLKQAEELAVTIVNVEQRAKQLILIGFAQGRAADKVYFSSTLVEAMKTVFLSFKSRGPEQEKILESVLSALINTLNTHRQLSESKKQNVTLALRVSFLIWGAPPDKAHLKQALELARKIKPSSSVSFVRSRFLSEIAALLSAAGEFEQATVAAQSINENWGGKYRRVFCVKVLLDISRAQVKAGEKIKARGTLRLAAADAQKIQTSFYKRRILKEIGNAQIDIGDKEQGEITLKLVAELDQKAKTASKKDSRVVSEELLIVITNLVQAGDFQQALEIAQKGPFWGEWRYEDALEAIIIPLVEAKDWKQLAELVRKIKKYSLHGTGKNSLRSVLRDIVDNQIEVGDNEAAGILLKLGVEAAAKSSDFNWWKDLASVQFKIGEKEQSFSTLKLAVVAVQKSDMGVESRERNRNRDRHITFRKIWELREIARNQIEKGDKEQARVTLKLAVELTAEGLQKGQRWSYWGPTLLSIANTLSELGNSDQALGAFELAMKYRAPHPHYSDKGPWGASQTLLKGIAVGQSKAGNNELASSTFKLALNEALKSEITLTLSELISIGEKQAETVGHEQASSTFNLAILEALKIEDTHHRDRLLRSISRALAGAGDFTLALEVSQKIEGRDSKISSLREVGRAQFKAGEGIQAMKAFKLAVAEAQNIEEVKERDSDLVLILGSMGITFGLGGGSAKPADLQYATEVAQKITDPRRKALSLQGILKAATRTGEKPDVLLSLVELNLDAIKKVEKSERAWGLGLMAAALSVELVPARKEETVGPIRYRMKKFFTPTEKRTAKKIVRALQVN